MNDLKKTQLKQQLSTLFKGNEAEFVEVLNEVLVENWLADQEEELLLVNMFGSNFVTFVKNEIHSGIGEKYANSPSKLATLLNAFIDQEIIEKGTDKEARIKMSANLQILDGVKAVVKHFDKAQGENW